MPTNRKPANRKTPGPSRHYPEETSLSLPHTPALDRIVRESTSFAEMAARFNGMRDWTEEDKEAVRKFNAQTERMWEARRLQIAAQRMNITGTGDQQQQKSDIKRHPDEGGAIEGMHYTRKRRGGGRS